MRWACPRIWGGRIEAIVEGRDLPNLEEIPPRAPRTWISRAGPHPCWTANEPPS